MKYVLSLIFFIFLTVACSSAPPVRIVDEWRAGPQIAADIRSKTVALEAVSAKTLRMQTFCAGVWIAPDYVLTAAHCTRRLEQPGDTVSVRTADGSRAAASLVARDEETTDLALLRVFAAPAHAYANLRAGAIEVGEPCFIMGHPHGFLDWSFVVGSIAGFRTDERVGYGHVIQTQSTVWFGNSGGGMFDAEGNLEGVASTLDPDSRFSFFIHRDVIRDFLLKKN